MKLSEIYRSITAQVDTACQNNILLEDCVLVIGCDVVNTIFRNMPFDVEVKDCTICGIQCCISSTNRNKCELLIPMEDINEKR